jgi:DNA-binding MarR family transcriptional regulator
MSAKKQSAAAARADHPAGRDDDSTVEMGFGPRNLLFLYIRIFYAIRTRSEDALKPYNLTPMQFTIMATLGRTSGLSSAELSRRFNVTPQTMGEMVANLERRALVERGQDQANRRALKLSLTQAGRRLVQACDAEMKKLEAGLVEGLSPRQREELRSTLDALHDHLGLRIS